MAKMLLEIDMLIKKEIIMKYNLVSSSFNHQEIKAINKVVKSDMYSMGKNV